MKFAAKRFISIILVIVMCMQALPVTVFAALIDNDPEYNEEILDALTELVGSEDEAERYYALLDHYGLIDEDGNLAESWEIWMDGKQVTLEDIIAELEKPDCDRSKYVLVDGTAITLGDIETILEIENYIAYLRATYYNGSEWTNEHTDNLESLINQIENEGILFTNAGATDEIVWPSGYSHEARVSVETYPVITSDKDNSVGQNQSPERIFDGRNTTKWYSTSGVSNSTRQEFPLWVQIELAEAVTVGSYGIVTGDDRPDRDPYTWILYGSDDGEEWTELDEQTEYVMTEERGVEESFALSEAQTFSHFRLEILERQGGTEESSHGYGVQMSELCFYDEAGDRISLESNKFRVRLYDAAPGQTVSFTWGAHSGSQNASGGGDITMTADENGKAEEELTVTLLDSEDVRSNARLTYFIKCDDLEGALFENGYPNMTLYGYSEPTVSDELMTAVKNAGAGITYSTRRTQNTAATVDGKKVVTGTYSFNDTENAAYGTAIDWGVLSYIGLEPQIDSTDSLVEIYDLPVPEGEYVPYNDVCKATWQVTVRDNDTLIIDIARAAVPFGNMNDDGSYSQNTIEDSVYDDGESPLTALIGLEDKTVNVVGSTWIYANYRYTGNGTFYFTQYDSIKTPNWTLPWFDLTLSRPEWTSSPWINTIRAATYANYVPGHHIPIVVQFTEPVKPSVKLTLNGTEYNSLESVESDTYTNVLTYMYEVKQLDDLSLWCTGVSPFTNLTGWTVDNYIEEGWDGLQEIEWAKMKTPYALDAITDIYSEVTGDIKEPMFYFSVGITDEEKMTEWISTEQDDDGELYIDGLTVSLDGGETMHKLYFAGNSFADGLYANIPLEIIDEKSSYVAELFQTDENGEKTLLLGKYAAGTHSWALNYITEDDISASVDFGDYAFENEENPVIYVQSDMPEIKADFTLSGSDFSFGDISSVAVYGTPEAEDADFVWRSTNPTVASIDKNGYIIPTGASGETQITLTARNGGYYEETEVTVAATYVAGENTFDTLRFVSGTTPFLTIPQDKVKTVDGKNAVVYWSSNISDKNANYETVFDVAVTHNGDKVYTTAVSGNAETIASFVEIPGEYLIFDYMNGNNTYEVTVSVEYEGNTYSDTAEITVEALPASVALGKLDSYYITDTVGTLPISWSVEHLNRAGETDLDELFIFNVMRNNDVVEHDVVLNLNNGSDSGVYNLPITDITASKNEPGSYREVYTVTIQAKNGADSTWSYDSFLLYVYDEDALKIMVDGEEADDTLLMSNVEAISNMSQAEILALERDIHLKNIISINFGDYAWTEVADQIMWASENSDYVSINYQQGIMYENIENYSYTSYRPTVEFGLNGHHDGRSLVSAIHKLTGMEDTVDVTVETLRDKLYLFKFYPKAKTKLEYKNADGEWQVRYSDENGEAAIYEEKGIHSNVYCTSEVDGITYVGTYYFSKLETGEGDWTKLERYPLNNLNLRRTGYAYLYIKDPYGDPYTGDIIFRGGVYVNGEYIESALFGLNSTIIDKKGNEDNIISLDETGKLSVYMNTEQWNLELGDITSRDAVEYVFEIRAKTDESDGINNNLYYPILHIVDATYNADDYVGGGSAIISFRPNDLYDAQQWMYLPQQHIAMQRTQYTGYAVKSDVFGTTGKIGPNNNYKEATLTTSVMWWGTPLSENEPDIQLKTEDGKRIAASPGQYEMQHNAYPFTYSPVTNYTVWLNKTTVDEIELKAGKSIGLHLDLYSDGETLSRHEVLPFKLTNLIGVGNVQEAKSLPAMLENMGSRLDTNDRNTPTMPDAFVEIAMGLIDNDSYSTGDKKGFCMKVFPTSDPTKFLGFIEANIGKLPNTPQIDGFFTPEFEELKEPGTRVKTTPGLSELMLAARKKTFGEYVEKDVTGTLGKSGYRNISPKLSGYAESLIYYNERTGDWEIQVLNGGFEVGAGVAYTWTWNYFAGPVPVNISLTIGGTVEVGLDTLGVTYFDVQQDATLLGTDFLTELRVYLYLRFFAGIGFDYSIIAFKLGIYGQISLDTRFQWLNRPYMDVENDIYNVADGTYNDSYLVEIPSIDVDENGNHWIMGSYWESPHSTLNGQRFKLDGQIGLMLVVRFLFFSFEKVLLSFNFNLFDETTGDWELIQTNWEKNKAAQMEAISGLLGTNSLTVSNAGGQQIFSLNLAPTLESRSYLENGSYWNDGSVSLFALDEINALQDLQYNSYPYANPVITDDGAIVAYLSDMGSENVEDTRVSFAQRNEFGMYNEGTPIDDGEGYGDTQVAVAGKEDFAVAAWTRQTETVNKDAGSVINASDQMIMMNSSEIYAGVYNGNEWVTTRFTDNQQADMAPVVAVNGNRAIVAWRNVASSAANKTAEDYSDITNFTEKDDILYRIYDGTQWSDTYTLYNGTSGAVKGISAAMLSDGTAAVTYTLDTDYDAATVYDRDVYYAVVDNDSTEVKRNVRATLDAYLDENPQITAVTFPNGGDEEYFVLGWFSQQAVANDTAEAMSDTDQKAESDTLSDIRLMAFDSDGIYAPLLPDSISRAADAEDVEITSNFRFVKNASTINDLSIVWVQRAGEVVEGVENKDYMEKDALKGIKFYTFGQNSEMIGFTSAIDIAKMSDGTLIDHFDAYVSDPSINEVKAVILGTTYGADGVVTRVGETVGGDIVQYAVPSSTTSMYTATEVYQDKIEVPGVLVDYDTVKKGSDTEIMFIVKNKGIHAVSDVEITLNDGKGEAQTKTFTGLNILPGSSANLYADYYVPADEVVDVTYSVHATFNEVEGASGSAKTTKTVTYRMRTTTEDLTTVEDTVYLDIPELQIASAEIIEAKDMSRTILVKLNNGSDASLARDGRTVKINFYSDSTCESPIDDYYIDPIVIDDPAELAMIDEGGYSKSVTFRYLNQYVAEISGNELDEIPENGISVYIKAEAVELNNEGEYAALPDLNLVNNHASVLCESLWNRSENDAMLSYVLNKDNDGCNVLVTVQNMRLSKGVDFGNIIVKLYDADGNVVGLEQFYTAENYGELHLGAEGRIIETFSFDGEKAKTAVRATVDFAEFEVGEDSSSNAKLAEFSALEIPELSIDDFVMDDDGVYCCNVYYNADNITLVIRTESIDTKIYYNGTATNSSSFVKEFYIPDEAVFGEIQIVTQTTNGNSVRYDLVLAKQYSVSFDSNGGTGTMDSISVTEGESIVLPVCTFTPPDKHEFKAWSVNGTEMAAGTTVQIKENTTITAIYSPPVKIEFVDISSGETEIIKTYIVSPSGEKVTAPDMPVKKGHIFEGWYNLGNHWSEEQPFNPDIAYSVATVFYAKYTPFELSVERNGDSYTAFATLGKVKDGAEYSWHICEFSGTAVTLENAEITDDSGYENGKWTPSSGNAWFRIDVKKGDVLIVTPDDIEEFEEPVVFDGQAEAEMQDGSWIITFKENGPFELTCWNHGDVTTPVSAKIGKYVATEAVDGETEANFSSGVYGKRYVAMTEFSDGTIVTSRAFKFEIKKEHTVTFVDYDGTELAKYTVEQGYSATAPEAPVREGYKFTGWDKAFDYITDSIVVTAQYEEKQNASVDTAHQQYDYNYGNAVPFVIKSNLSGFTVEYSAKNKSVWSKDAPTNAGIYDVRITRAEDATYKAYDFTIVGGLTINKIEPTYTKPSNLTATYGDTLASVQLPEGWKWNVTDTAETVGDAGENRFSVIYTHPEGTDNYKQVTDEVTIAVAPKEVTANVILDSDSFVYSGSEHKPGVTVKDSEDVIPSGEYTVSYTNNVNAGTATVTVTDVDGGNYTVNGSTSFEITKKASVAIPAIEREFVRTVASAGNEIDIEEMLPDDHGNVSYRLSDDSYTVLENVSISTDGKLVFDTKTSDASASDSITVKVEMQNYTNVTVTVSVILGEKTTQSITGVSAAEGLVYNKNAQQGYTGTPTSEKYTGAYEITYTGRNNSYNSTTAPTDAGDYTVTFKIPDSELYYSGNLSINFTIAKAKAEIVVDTAPIVRSYSEQFTLPTPATNFGTVTVDKSVSEMTNVGEYTVTYTVAENENYNGDTKQIKVTIVPKKITRPTQASAVTYTGSAQTYAVTETADYYVTNGVQTNANEDGYNVIIALKDKDNTVWDDETVADLTHKFVINRKAIEEVAGVPTPVAAQTAQTTVNGENYSGTAKWNPDVTTFGYFMAYDVTLTLTANANFKFADNISLEGYAVSSNNGTTLVLTKTFDETAKAKITSVTAPTVDKLAVYGTLEDALSVMPNTVTAVTEAGNTTLPIAWAVVGEYDKTPGVSNTFKWTANVGDYDANGQTLTGNITVENADALGVVNTGTPAEITYDGSSYDVSTMFTKDTNAGEASYEIVILGTEGEGTGTLGDDGMTLAITKAGIITVKMTTAANGAYAQGSTQATLTVNLGTGIADVAIEGWTYGEDANAPIVTSETNGTDNVTYLYESTDDKGYNSSVAPTTAGTYKVTATFAATDLYAKAEDSAEFTIEKAQPTVKTPPGASRVKKGNLLSNSTLTGGEMLGVDGEALEGTFAWKNPEKEMNTRGNIEVITVFTPNDTVNYNTADVTLTVEVYTTNTGGSGISVTTYYNVKFNTNGGSNVPAQSIRRNSTADEPKAPTKDGYTFEGWYTDAECTKAYDFDAKVTKDITLYAKWIENKPIEPEITEPCDGTEEDKCPSIAFTDLDTNAWYHLDVDYALENELMNGMGESIFAPNGKLSRAMLVTILWRLEGKPVVNYLMTFEDVDAESWYGEAVRWAASEKIVLGHSAESFAPDDDITREQIAAIMHRYAKYKGIDVSVGENTNILSYDDAFDISEYAMASMQYAVGSGLIKGKSESTLNPLDNATRAEIAAILHRFIVKNK